MLISSPTVHEEGILKHLLNVMIAGGGVEQPSDVKPTYHGHKTYPDSSVKGSWVHPSPVYGAGSKQTSVPGGPEGGVMFVVQPRSPTAKSREQNALDLLLPFDFIISPPVIRAQYCPILGNISTVCKEYSGQHITQMVMVRILRSRIHISVQILQLDQIGREL